MNALLGDHLAQFVGLRSAQEDAAEGEVSISWCDRRRVAASGPGHATSCASDEGVLRHEWPRWAFDGGAATKPERAASLLGETTASSAVALSASVLQEFQVVTTPKLAKPLSAEDALAAVTRLSGRGYPPTPSASWRPFGHNKRTEYRCGMH